jgi:hypothetical protein
MAEWRIAFRLLGRGSPRAVFVTDYGLSRGRLLIEDTIVVDAPSRAALASGVSAELPGSGERVTVRLSDDDLGVWIDGVRARREDELRAPSSRSAWLHGWIALLASAFGFIASYLYVLRARALQDPWSMRMAWHMAAWHLLLTLTLFPASVWGQRIGIRAVQGVSALFFAIHVGIGLANVDGFGDPGHGPWVALLNAASGLAFLTAVVYGQRAHADMDPLRAPVARAGTG